MIRFWCTVCVSRPSSGAQVSEAPYICCAFTVTPFAALRADKAKRGQTSREDTCSEKKANERYMNWIVNASGTARWSSRQNGQQHCLLKGWKYIAGPEETPEKTVAEEWKKNATNGPLVSEWRETGKWKKNRKSNCSNRSKEYGIQVYGSEPCPCLAQHRIVVHC